MFKLLGKISELLDQQERRRLWMALTIGLAIGVGDMIGVMSVIPFLVVAADPSSIEEKPSFAKAYDFFEFSDDTQFLIALALCSLVTISVVTSLRIFGLFYLRRFARGQSVSFASRLFAQYMQKSLDRTHTRHSASLISNIQSEVERVVNGVMMNAVRLFANGSTAIFLVLLLIVVEPAAAITMGLLLGCGYGAVFSVVSGRIRHLGAERVRANAQAAKTLGEALAGSREIWLYGMQGFYRAKFEEAYRRKNEAQTMAELLRDVPKSVLELLTFGTMILLVIWSLSEGAHSSGALPLVVLYAFAAARLIPALQRVYAAATALRTDLPSLDALWADLSKAEFEGARAADVRTAPRLERALELKGISYWYPGSRQPAIRDLSLTVPAGSFVGIVGATGAGKSTILDLMAGLLTPASGSISVDGTSIDDRNRSQWRKRVAYVPQEISLVQGSIRENIEFGLNDDHHSKYRIWRAGAFAGLDPLIADLQDGYDTKLHERGINLSVGQRQRIGIARAVYREPDLLVMDESTSALDALSEAELNAAVASLRGKTTVVIAAHRLSSVRKCDTIIVIADGREIESGCYSDLMASGSLFRSLVNADM
ncbi:ABC transporter ATP-binding protein [Limimaricola sp. G21655-S1]|uniref:ABC transporter ATP-binding protein n=1 Tax=Limimaricola sp. G21655-S1 TaxID=3014768 RepID=UPI0022AF6788|nr:ABC transporter ATP-binding protein [Limimaricola sp. G21655-S1]MCZ4261552.1 ABC transporter ATP-binding protein [Limimaricola sp. G21655-S1]